MAKIIIFGVMDFAELAYYYLSNDTDHEVIAFCVSQDYLPHEKIFNGLPVVPFESIEEAYSPKEFKLFAPMSSRKMSVLRKRIYTAIKRKKYEMISYISSNATLFNTRVGENCFILEGNTIQPFSRIGNNVVLWSGNHIGHHSTIKDHVFFTSHVVLSGHCVVEPYCFFGVNSTIKDGVLLAEGSFVSMSAAITEDTEPWSVYKGNPAKKMNYSSKDLA